MFGICLTTTITLLNYSFTTFSSHNHFSIRGSTFKYIYFLLFIVFCFFYLNWNENCNSDKHKNWCFLGTQTIYKTYKTSMLYCCIDVFWLFSSFIYSANVFQTRVDFTNFIYLPVNIITIVVVVVVVTGFLPPFHSSLW